MIDYEERSWRPYMSRAMSYGVGRAWPDAQNARGYTVAQCEAARQALHNIGCAACDTMSCPEIYVKLCQQSCDIFNQGNDPVRMGLCHTMTCPAPDQECENCSSNTLLYLAAGAIAVGALFVLTRRR